MIESVAAEHPGHAFFLQFAVPDFQPTAVNNEL
jgi:hypothetical protein